MATITSAVSGKAYPIEVCPPIGAGGLPKESTVLLNQIKTIGKTRLETCVGQLDAKTMLEVDEALKISLGLAPL